MAQSRTAPLPAWPVLALTRMEWRMGRRTAAFRFLVLATFLFGCSVGGGTGRGVASSAYATAEAAWKYLGFVAILWMSLAAVRETALRTDILVSSKPQPNERLALAKFLGAFLQILAALLALFAGAACARLYTGGGLLGAEVYGEQYLRAAGVLFFAASASFTLALLFDSAIAGALVGLYWLLTLSGKAFLGKFYFPAYTQNLGAYLALGLGLLCLTLLLHRRSRRGAARAALWVRLGVPVGLLLAGWLFWTVIRDGHDPHARLNPALGLMGEQDTTLGAHVAGFWLPDQNGHLTGLADFPGKIMVVGLWSPDDPDSVLMLDRLNDMQARYGAQGVQVVAIALSEDNSAAPTFARGEHLPYPVVTDWGTYNAPDRSDISPLAGAYRANLLPEIVVTDRRHRVQALLNGNQCYDSADLDERMRQQLTAEPR